MIIFLFAFGDAFGHPIGQSEIRSKINHGNFQFNILERVRRQPQTTSSGEICTTVYESECKTIYEEREVDEDTIKCETIQEEKCKEVEKGCVLNCEPICVKLPAKRCKVETNKVIKYTPETQCNKVPSKVCGPRSGK